MYPGVLPVPAPALSHIYLFLTNTTPSTHHNTSSPFLILTTMLPRYIPSGKGKIQRGRKRLAASQPHIFMFAFPVLRPNLSCHPSLELFYIICFACNGTISNIFITFISSSILTNTFSLLYHKFSNITVTI